MASESAGTLFTGRCSAQPSLSKLFFFGLQRRLELCNHMKKRRGMSLQINDQVKRIKKKLDRLGTICYLKDSILDQFDRSTVQQQQGACFLRKAFE